MIWWFAREFLIIWCFIYIESCLVIICFYGVEDQTQCPLHARPFCCCYRVIGWPLKPFKTKIPPGDRGMSWSMREPRTVGWESRVDPHKLICFVSSPFLYTGVSKGKAIMNHAR